MAQQLSGIPLAHKALRAGMPSQEEAGVRVAWAACHCACQNSVHRSQKFPDTHMWKRSLLPLAGEETEAQGPVSSRGSHSTENGNRI